MSFDITNIDFGEDSRQLDDRARQRPLLRWPRPVQGRDPERVLLHNKDVPQQTALPFGTSYETFRNPGPTFKVTPRWRRTARGSRRIPAIPTGTPTTRARTTTSLNVDDPVAGGDTVDFWTWYFIEEGWDFGFVEALVGTEWVTVPLVDDAGTEVTTNDNPHDNNTEGNGLTGTSGGAYFVDDPVYIHLAARCRPAPPMSASATRPTRRTSTPAGSWTTSRSTTRRRRSVRSRATGSRRPASRTTTGSCRSCLRATSRRASTSTGRDRRTRRASCTASKATTSRRPASRPSA